MITGLDAETTERFSNQAHAAAVVFEKAFAAWVKAQPDDTVMIAAAVSGMGLFAAKTSLRIDTQNERVPAVVGAALTMIVNSGCDPDLLSKAMRSAIFQMNPEVAGNA